MMLKSHSHQFQSLLPPNASKLEKAVEEACFRCTNLSGDIDELWNPGIVDGDSIFQISDAQIEQVEKCPMSLLPFLAWGCGCEIWNSDWSEGEKRRIIVKYLEIRRMRGTLMALEEAYKALGVTLEVKEWFDEDANAETKDKPYHFQVKLYIRNNSALVSKKNKFLIEWMTDRLKPLRSSYDLDIVLTMEAQMNIGCVFRVTHIQKIFGDFSHIA